MNVEQIIWEEPNRSGSPPLYITSGEPRFSTVTGVCWLDEFRFVANHQVGLKIALFDTRTGARPISKTDVPSRSDAITARPIAANTWEVVVSGCWDVTSYIYKLTICGQVEFERVGTVNHVDQSFCHGVSHGRNGDLCYAFHTGENPRIKIGAYSYGLPQPWGPRHVCYDPETCTYYAVAVSANASRTSYKKTGTSIWRLHQQSQSWEGLFILPDRHADSCGVYGGLLWFPDQKHNCVIGVALAKKRPPIVVDDNSFDFPHGLAVSNSGTLALTNYGSSSISLFNLNQFVDKA